MDTAQLEHRGVLSVIIVNQGAGDQEQPGAGVDQPLPDRVLLEDVGGQLLPWAPPECRV